MRIILSFVVLLALVGCAETDPYTRPKPAYTGISSTPAFVYTYNSRWPKQFKSVQTVTIDFGPVTKTLIGYLVVQRPGRFRLNAMTEQGMTIFELAHYDGYDTYRINTDEFSETALDNVSRDIQRIFLHQISALEEDDPWKAAGYEIKFASNETGAALGLQNDLGVGSFSMVGRPAVGEREIHRRFLYGDDFEEYRIDYYDYGLIEGLDARYPGHIVLRERAIGPEETPYKLTIQITELESRDKIWPPRVFLIPEEPE
ncbi:MAG: hypothetical protein V3V10_07450 [Planctomycetota bacterium]